MRRHTMTALLLAAAFLPQTAQANGDHDAHVHGVAQLLLTRDGHQLELTLESPAANLLGFEHPPASAEDREAINQAVASLRDTERLFTISGGNCTVVDVQITSPFEKIHHHAEHSHHGDDDAGHRDSHSEFHVSYQYECDANAEIKQLKTGLLAVFPAIELLHVQWITEHGQSAERLSGNNDMVYLQ